MSASSAAKLYTPDVLSLATELAGYPLHDELPLRGEARSRTCGSHLSIGLKVNEAGAIEALGMRVSACAVGQASAALFTRDSAGRTLQDLKQASDAIERWLTAGCPLPDWPGLDIVEPARMHTARHGAIMLPWRAAIDALSKPNSSS